MRRRISLPVPIAVWVGERGRCLRVAAGTTLVGLSVAAAASAQGSGGAQEYPLDPLSVPRPSLVAVRTDAPIVIDGRLDDDAWTRATPTREVWIQTTPDPGMPATEHTTLRVLYDDERLYVGAVMLDTQPSLLSVPGLEQDFDTPNADMLAIALDTYHDRINGFVFAVNPAGAIWDAQVFNDQRDILPAWEGIVDVGTSVNDSSWVVELAIPFATLRFNPVDGDQLWGANFMRRIRRTNEDVMWAPLPLQYRAYKFSMAGTLEGLSGLPRGRNLSFKPYLLGDRLTGARFGEASTDGGVGLDVKWGLTPRMTLDLSANTDFSQVEVDSEQVNLTRFSLFFPERRDFFLENEGTFSFTDTSIRNYRTGSNARAFRLFNSRRIGLSDSREPLPIGGGARLTGRIGDRVEIGVLDMQTRSTGELAGVAPYRAENFAVARVKGQPFEGATLGAIFVNRQETTGSSPAYNRSYGIDGSVTALQNLLLSGYFARTDDSTPIGASRDIAMAQAAWRSSFWNVSGLLKRVGDGFEPRTGFVDRIAVRRAYGTVGVHPRVLRHGVREVNPYVELDTYTDLTGRLETRTVRAGVVVSFLSGGMVTAQVADRYERLFEDTGIAGRTVGVGRYEWLEPSVRVSTPGNRSLFGSVSYSWGDFYDGSRTSIGGSVTLRPDEHVSLNVGVQHNDLRLGGSSFTADLFSGRLRYALDTRTFFLAFVQYNEASEELIANARVNIIHAPLSDVFLVYTERRSLADTVAESLLERGITVKVTRLLAF